MKLLLALLLCALAVVAAAAACSKPSKANIVWLMDSAALAENELQAVAGLIQAVGEDLHLSPEGVRMGFVDAAATPRLEVGLTDVVDYGKQLPKMRDAATALEAMGNEVFAQILRRPGNMRILILLSTDARVEAAAVRAFKNNQDVLILLLQVGRAAPPPDFVDFIFRAADFDELATTDFRSSFLCLDEVMPHSNPVLSARSLAMAPAPNRRLVAGLGHFNYIQSNGEVYSWGYNEGLGANTTFNSAFPLPMLSVTAASYVSAGQVHTCVVDGGAAKCCGFGGSGRLGNGASATSYTVVQVQGLTTGVSQVIAGSQHSCAILDSGGMKCWGQGYYGLLGNGGNAPSKVPVNVTNYASGGVHSACGGSYHTCIVTTEGAALCTGMGAYGQLGNNGTADQFTMSPVTDLTSGSVTQISCGDYHTCALLSTGALACFGFDHYGQLGMGNDGSKTK